MMKVVLINAIGEGDWTRNKPGPYPCLGLLSIATHFKKRFPKNYIKILDGQLLSVEEIEYELKKIKPDFTGIGFVYKNYQRALRYARLAKNLGAKVLFGGHYATAIAVEILKNRGINSEDYCVDAVIVQDGEEAFTHYIGGRSLTSINNLIYCRGNKIIKNKVKLFPLPDNLSILDPEFINLDEYFQEYRRRFPTSPYKNPLLIITQRGCSWRSKTGGCVFCTVMQKDFRLRSPKEIWSEIDKLVDKYGIDYIGDGSDNFLGNKFWFEEFYKEFKKRRTAPAFRIYARSSNLCNEKIVAMLKEMNITHIFIGFESNDDKILVNIKKGALSYHNEKALRLLRKYKISIRAYLLLGLLGEDENSLFKTVNFAKKLYSAGNNNMLIPRLLRPIPGSEAFELLVAKLKHKYAGKDLINWDECAYDWVKNFCRVPYKIIKKHLEYLKKFPRTPTALSY